MPRLFCFVEHGDGIVLYRDAALAIVAHHQLVAADAIGACPFAGRDHRGRADEDPVYIRLAAQLIEEGGGLERAVLPLGGKSG